MKCCATVIKVRFQNEEISNFKNGQKEGEKETRSKIITQKKTKFVELWSDSCGARRLWEAPPLAARPYCTTTNVLTSTVYTNSSVLHLNFGMTRL